MLFNSIEFLIFFPAVIAGYFALPHRFRWILLLLASYYFYMCWNYNYVVLIATATGINYLSGYFIAKSNSKLWKKVFLSLGVVTSLAILFFYKYFNFFGNSINEVFSAMNVMAAIPHYNVLLPVGISFYTFQTLSYTIDVYFGKQPVEKHFGIFALYVSFFPQLVAGPIERSLNLLPQFYEKHKFDYSQIRDGIVLMAWGFFKKIVIADRLSEYVNIVYNNPTDHSGMQFLMATFFFCFQIYCDFSGYSDIALGTAQIMGFRLMTNFRRPYFALNIKEFWQRWHISLSTWFRDYVYIPMGGNRVVKWRWKLNLFITFLVSGIWHGANWTFAIWGALHGVYQIIEIYTVKFKEKYLKSADKISNFSRIGQILFTFSLVAFAWIFFRANTVKEAFLVIGKIFSVNSYSGAINLFHFKIDFLLSIILVISLITIEVFLENGKLVPKLRVLKRSAKWVLLIGMALIIMVLGKWDSMNFLYFQF